MISKVIYDIETSIRELESSFFLSDLNKKEKENNFHIMCKFISLANDALTSENVHVSIQIPLLKSFYGDSLNLDGCYHPILMRIFETQFSSASEGIADAYLNTELQLWIFDDICELLDDINVII